MDPIPVYKFKDLEDSLKKKIERLSSDFESNYGSIPQFFARVPGRVNLIGEHIDYCGYAVFPMAIDQEILVAASPNSSSTLELTNQDSQFQAYDCNLIDISIDKGVPYWYKYFLCGIKGILQFLEKDKPCGMKARVLGVIPPSAGLSSSSALVCAAALAFAHANKVAFTKKELADCCAKSERYIGTEGGGMDQAIAMLATKGTAKLIEFNPLRAHDAKLPPGAVFVICHSLAEANKAASSQFNCRVMECRLAAKVLARLHGVEHDSITRLVDVQSALNKTLPEMALCVQQHLHDEPYGKQEIAKLLKISIPELETKILSENTRDILQFKLKQRALHVFEEANRVWRFQEICNSGSESSLKELGQLMFDSHSSCRDLYECSHPQLDKLVQLSVNRCSGSRLTGAGWGGCIVALVPEEGVQSYISYLKKNFYKDLSSAQNRNLDEVIFATQPGAGAAIITL